MITDTHGAVAVQYPRFNQLFTVQFRCGTQGGESEQSNNQLCSHGSRQQAARESNTNVRDPAS